MAVKDGSLGFRGTMELLRMGMGGRILVVDDEETLRLTFENFLVEEGYEVVTAANYDEAVTCLDTGDVDLIFADIILGGRTGIDLLHEVRSRLLTCPVIVITGQPSVGTAAEAVRLGAFEYLSKPVRQKTLVDTARRGLLHKMLADQKEYYRKNLEAIFRSLEDAIISVDQEMVVLEINRAAQELCGVRREDAVGQGFVSIASDHCMQHCGGILRKTIERKEPLKIERMECPNAAYPRKIVNITTMPLLDHQERSQGAVMVVRDESHLAQLERDLNARRQFDNLVGTSHEMQRVYALIEDLADVQTTVLITGESGTGKELIAEALHHHGIRRDKPLVKVNCGALSQDLLESELFGHARGAFTGAIKDKIGRFQQADGGTIFLDEIGDLTLPTQLRLLRVLQEQEFERVGESTPTRVDVRVIAATHQDLRRKVASGGFREDLFYRLNVVGVHLPPLRERRKDIPLLVNHFLKKFSEKLQKPLHTVSEDVQSIFMDHAWPGNVRELQNVLEHGSILSRQGLITVNCLPPEFKDKARPGRVRRTHDDGGARLRDELVAALEKTSWNKTQAARLLGVSRQTLHRRIRKYKVDRELR